MELFTKAKTVHLRSHHGKYLVADDDQEGVFQERNGSSCEAKWTVEIIEGSNAIRFKSFYGRYLTASNIPFLLGTTGRKVLQTLPRRLDSSVEWEPIRAGVEVRLRTRYGQYLRANAGPPPWRNSVTHDVPRRTAHKDWVLWEVDVVEARPVSPERRPTPQVRPATSERRPVHQVSASSSYLHSSAGSASWSSFGSFDDGSTLPPAYFSVPAPVPVLTKHESLDYIPDSVRKRNERMIRYRVADDHGEVDDDSEPNSLMFNGSTVEELTERLQEETELDDIIVCTRNLLMTISIHFACTSLQTMQQ